MRVYRVNAEASRLAQEKKRGGWKVSRASIVVANKSKQAVNTYLRAVPMVDFQ